MNAKKHQEDQGPVPSEKHLCIIQLTRLGDVIQTYQACLKLKNHHPDVKLTLVAYKQFASPLNFLLEKVFDQVICIDTNTMLSTNNGMEGALENLRGITNKINQHPVNAVVNLSYSQTSEYLCSLINTRHIVGSYRNRQNQVEIHDRWSQFVYSNVLGGNLNPYSLVDLFKFSVGVPISPRPEIEIDLSTRKYEIVLHPFSSQDKKTWKASKWTEVLYKLLKRDQNIALTVVGSKQEREASEKLLSNPIIKAFSDRITNKVGQTNLQELYETIGNARLFVGNDSMCGHFAACTNTPSLTLALGTVREYETTPYGDFAYVLAPRTGCYPCNISDHCDHFKCHSDIPYQVVSEVISEILAHQTVDFRKITETCSSFATSSVNLLHSKYSNIGVFDLTRQDQNENTVNDIMRLLYRISFTYYLLQKEEKQDFPKISANSVSVLRTISGNVQYLYELAEFGKKYTEYILKEISSETPNIQNMKKHSAKIDEIDHLQDVIKSTCPELAPLIDFFAVFKSNISGNNLVELTENAYVLYSDYSTLCSILFELIDKSLVENNFPIKNQEKPSLIK